MPELRSKVYREIEHHAGNAMSKAEIEIILKLESGIIDKVERAQECYNRGFLKSKATLRASIFSLANQGSPQAQELAAKFLSEVELENMMHGQSK